MNAPVDLRQGRILLLSEPGSFHAAYIKRSLEMIGIDVLAPDGTSAAEALATIDPAEWLSITAALAVDLGETLLGQLPGYSPAAVPWLFVGQRWSDWLADPYRWLCPPFAAFQVVDMLNEMVAAAADAFTAALPLGRPA